MEGKLIQQSNGTITLYYTEDITCPCCLLQYHLSNNLPDITKYKAQAAERRKARELFKQHILNLASLDINQKQIAMMLNCSQGYVSKIISGKSYEEE